MSRHVLNVDLGEKQPSEVLDWKIGISRSLGTDTSRIASSIESVTVSRTDAAESPVVLKAAPPDVPAAAIVNAGKAILFWTSGGTAAGRYRITFEILSSDGTLLLEIDAFLKIRET